MGRPKKNNNDTVIPTKERILSAAITLFSKKGYRGTPVREIARAVGLNEASLYNHYPGKAAILDAAIERLVAKMIAPELGGFYEEAWPENDEGVAERIFSGAKRFFARADDEMLKIWRILMMEQYGNPAAKKAVRAQILSAPRAYFRNLFEDLVRKGRIPEHADITAAADIVAALFFEFSFVSNLSSAWSERDPADSERLHRTVLHITAGLEKK